MKEVTIWEKLKLQIDNLEVMYGEHLKGNDMSSQSYWQMEYLNELLQGLKDVLGASNVEKLYKNYVVKNDELECYGWEVGEKINILSEVPEDIPEKLYKVINVDRNEKALVLEHQIKEVR